MPEPTQARLFIPAPLAAPRYAISTWHGDPGGPCCCPDPACRGGWRIDSCGWALFALRPRLLSLHRAGWDRTSIYVEREEAPGDA